MPEATQNNIVNCDRCNCELNIDNDNYHNPFGEYYCNDCFFEYYFYCQDCGEVCSVDDQYYHEASCESFCQYCWESNGLSNNYRDNCIEFSPMRLNLSKTTYKHLRYRRCFGIELEINDNDLPYSDIEEGTCFGSKYDGSLNCGSEFYSPILQGDLGYDAIKKFCNLVGSANVGTCAGYHLHIDGRNLTWKSVKKIWLTYRIFEGVLLSMLPKSRQHNNYCKKSCMDINKIAKVYGREDLQDLWYSQGCNDTYDHYNDTRYFGCNLHSYFYQSTIEIRYHSGTTNFEKIINWIKINQAIFNYALNHSVEDILELQKFDNCYTNYTIIRKLFKKVVGNDTLWRYYKRRFNKFSNKKFGYYWTEENQRTLDSMAQSVKGREEAVECNNIAIGFNDNWALGDSFNYESYIADNNDNIPHNPNGDSRCDECGALDENGLCYMTSCANHPQSHD